MKGYIILDKVTHRYLPIIYKTWWLAHCAIKNMGKNNKYFRPKRYEILMIY